MLLELLLHLLTKEDTMGLLLKSVTGLVNIIRAVITHAYSSAMSGAVITITHSYISIPRAVSKPVHDAKC